MGALFIAHSERELNQSVKFLEQWLTRVSPVTAVLQGFVVTGMGGLESVLLNPKAHVVVTEFSHFLALTWRHVSQQGLSQHL